MDYVQWLIEVDSLLTDIYGLGHRDLPDFGWMEMFENDYTPRMAVEEFTEEGAE